MWDGQGRRICLNVHVTLRYPLSRRLGVLIKIAVDEEKFRCGGTVSNRPVNYEKWGWASISFENTRCQNHPPLIGINETIRQSEAIANEIGVRNPRSNFSHRFGDTVAGIVVGREIRGIEVSTAVVGVAEEGGPALHRPTMTEIAVIDAGGDLGLKKETSLSHSGCELGGTRPTKHLRHLTEIDAKGMGRQGQPAMEVNKLAFIGMAIIPAATKHSNRWNFEIAGTAERPRLVQLATQKSAITNIGFSRDLIKMNGAAVLH
jgi:hypothetical protein